MPVRYNGPNGVEELIPAPLVQIQKVFIKDEGGNKIQSEYTFTLTGSIVNIGTDKDSPDATTSGMEGILAEQNRIRTLFSKDGGRLEIEAPDGGGPNTIDAYCFVESIDFSQGIWVNRSDYVVVLKSTKTEKDPDVYEALTSKAESWSINENEDGTYTISHQLNAVGKIIYGASGINNPLAVAKQWCKQRSYQCSANGVLSLISSSGIDSLDFTTMINPLGSDSGNFWNRATVENIGPIANSWQLTETFVYNPSGSAKEEFSASLNYESENPRRLVITTNGTVVGFADTAKNRDLRLSNAKTRFSVSVEPNLYTRISSYVPNGYTLSPIPTSKQISYDHGNGSVGYSVGFTAVSGNLITNSIDESISIQDTGKTDVFAQIPIPGRANGPVVQNMKTSTLPERSISISASILPDTRALTLTSLAAMYSEKPNTDAIIDALKPSAGYFYIKQDNEEWNPIKRQYSRSVGWVLQTEGNSVVGIPSAVNNTI